MLQTLGGLVKVAENGGEYGRMAIRTTQASTLFAYEDSHSQLVWMSHGDEVIKLPPGFQSIATSEQVTAVPAAAACMSVGEAQHEQQTSTSYCQNASVSLCAIWSVHTHPYAWQQRSP